MPTLFAGTSGFAYPAWKPAFYPAKLPSKQFLKHYAERLNCVEINYTFRRLPAAATLEAWVGQTSPGFVFAVKANQRITHILRLRNAEQATEIFLKAIDPLRTSRRLPERERSASSACKKAPPPRKLRRRSCDWSHSAPS